MPPTLSNGDHGNGDQLPETGTPKKLVLCFDGTGNTFTGSNADTNVVKLLSKLDRNAPNQYHYYQTGIGTYDINEKSVNKTWFDELRSSLSQTIDQGIGTTFDAHVMAGYRFLMRYYNSGDKIYMFGFSRGAFTAKFLARMIYTVGLLCKGNEEMVPFAYRLYQRYLAGEVEDFNTAHPKKSKKGKKSKKKAASNGYEGPVNGESQPLMGEMHEGHRDDEDPIVHGHKYEVARDEIEAFCDTFCRKEYTVHCGNLEETNIKVFFLGIWDCVNSVAVLERTAPIPVPVVGTAHHVRHAVAVDERRVKFKAALLAQDVRKSKHNHEDIKEVWFPGCHGDVGGGWPSSEKNHFDSGEEMTIWERVKNFWTTRKAPKERSKAMGCDRFQMSDVPLAWMIREVEIVGEEHPEAAVKWRENRVQEFKDRFAKKKKQALKGVIHDSLAFGTGTGFFKVLLWKLMEWLPFITRWELEDEGWENVRFPLNKGATRDIPKDAVLHESVLWRLQNDPNYCPGNNHEPHIHDEAEHKTFLIAKSAHEIPGEGGSVSTGVDNGLRGLLHQRSG